MRIQTKHTRKLWNLTSLTLLVAGLIHFGIYFIAYAASGKQWSTDVLSLALSILPAAIIASLITLPLKSRSIIESFAQKLLILFGVLAASSIVSAFVNVAHGQMSYAIGEFILFAVPTLVVYVLAAILTLGALWAGQKWRSK